METTPPARAPRGSEQRDGCVDVRSPGDGARAAQPRSRPLRDHDGRAGGESGEKFNVSQFFEFFWDVADADDE